MQHITVKIKNLNQKYFSQYGKVLGPQDGVPSSSNEFLIFGWGSMKSYQGLECQN
jgi:hypothetical protein